MNRILKVWFYDLNLEKGPCTAEVLQVIEDAKRGKVELITVNQEDEISKMILEVFRDEGVVTTCVPCFHILGRKGKHIASFIFLPFVILKIGMLKIAGGRVEIEHVQPWMTFFVVLFSRIFGVFVQIRFYGIEIFRKYEGKSRLFRILSLLDFYSIKIANRIICVSQNIVDYLVGELRIDKEKVTVKEISSPFYLKRKIYGDKFVDPQILNRIKCEKKRGKSIVAFYSRLERSKGCLNFARSCRVLLDRGENLFVIFIGDGSLAHKCVEYLDPFIDESVLFLGHVKNPYPIIEMCDLICSHVPLDEDICNEKKYGGMGQTQMEVLEMGKVLISHYKLSYKDYENMPNFIKYNPDVELLEDLIIKTLQTS